MDDLISISNEAIMNTYRRYPILVKRGKGTVLWDSEGREYLDFISGLAVCNLGHCHDEVVNAICGQARELIHVSNLFYTEPQIRLADLLTKVSFADKVFFCNSGAEANEAAIKLARKYSRDNFGSDRYEIITMQSSFHGRTLATLTATGQSKFHKGFEPLPEGFVYTPYNDIGALSQKISSKTCAIFLEPIQGEGGINVPSEGFLENVRRLCNDRDLLLIFDEVQTGFGRTGTLFACENDAVTPDIMTLAKAMGGGLSIGAALAKNRVADSFTPGTHASTFGGNPVACAAGIALLNIIKESGFLSNVRDLGSYLTGKLEKMAVEKKIIKNIRGRGLMIGVELHKEGAAVVSECLKRGLLINCTMERVLRLLPPLTVRKDELDRAVSVLYEVL